MRRIIARSLVAFVVASAMLLTVAATANAHLTFVSIAPTDERELAAPPARVVLTFDKSIGAALKEVTLTSPDGDTSDLQPTIDGPRATLAMPREMEGGLWRVEWSATGPDGHPQRDSRTFTIAGGDANAGEGARSFPAGAWRAAGYVGRATFFAALLGFVGGGAFAMLAARGFRPWAWGAMTLALAVGALLVLASHVAVLHRLTVVELLGPTHWWDAASAQGGRGYALAAILAGITWRLGRSALAPASWQERGGRPPLLVALLLVLTAASPTLSSHAMSADPAWLRVPLDMLHVLAAAVWAGGLVQLLALTVPRRQANPGIPAAVDVYSFFAFVSVATLVVTGAFAAIVELDTNIGDLFGTTYGRLVLVKVALLALAAPLALANRRRHVPDLAERGPAGLPQLRRYVRGELAIAICIVLATAALVHSSPARDHAEHGGSHARHQA